MSLLETVERISSPLKWIGHELLPIFRDPAVERLIQLYRELPERERESFLSVMNVTAASLVGPSRQGDASRYTHAAR